MNQAWTHTQLGSTGLRVHRLGLAATYRPGKKTIYRALDAGLNLFFYFGIDFQMVSVLREALQKDRERYVVATGAYNYIFRHQNIRRTLEKRLRQLKTDYIDVFMFLGITKPKHFPEKVRQELYRLKEEGKVRSVGISTHDRRFAGRLAAEGKMDVLMIRYNAAHKGAEQDIFPYLQTHHPGIIGYTAMRWRYLLKRPRGYPKDGRIPTAGMCYRFVLSNPNVHAVLTAPTNIRQFEENLKAIQEGPLSDEDMAFMRGFGDNVYFQKKWFM